MSINEQVIEFIINARPINNTARPATIRPPNSSSLNTRPRRSPAIPMRPIDTAQHPTTERAPQSKNTARQAADGSDSPEDAAPLTETGTEQSLGTVRSKEAFPKRDYRRGYQIYQHPDAK